jgi:hypothetical protein
LKVESPIIFTHNVYAHLIGGSGVAALILLLHIGYLFAVWQPSSPQSPLSKMLFKEAQRVMRMVLILWFVRGMFTHEIIYSPSFCMALGLALGLELAYEPTTPNAAASRRLVRPRRRKMI